ncbi:MAG: HEPN domain-containing protein [Candidatus Aminicenantes bacterium]|nr:HEPN domain-containing protein [Candidatus Aminicenantes bacterium]
MHNHNIDLSKHRLRKSREELASSRLLFENNRLSQSINRSYYSIFHATRALLALDSFDSKTHTGVIAYFNKNFIKPGRIEKEYSKILMNAKDARNESDYDDFYIISKEETETQLNNAEKFINRIEAYINEKIRIMQTGA